MFSSFALSLGMLAATAGGVSPAPIVHQRPVAQPVSSTNLDSYMDQGGPSGGCCGGNSYQAHGAVLHQGGGCGGGNCGGGNCGGGCGSGNCGGGCGCGNCGGGHGSPVVAQPCGGYSLWNGDYDPRGRGDHCGFFVSCCNMPLHHAYYPQANGYYYFRPYNYTHIRQHQEIIMQLGGDKNHPYDTRFVFDKIYAQLEADGRIEPEGSGDEESDLTGSGIHETPSKDVPPKPKAGDGADAAPGAIEAAPAAAPIESGASLRTSSRRVARVHYVER